MMRSAAPWTLLLLLGLVASSALCASGGPGGSLHRARRVAGLRATQDPSGLERASKMADVASSLPDPDALASQSPSEFRASTASSASLVGRELAPEDEPNNLLVGTFDGVLHALNRENGDAQWQIEMGPMLLDSTSVQTGQPSPFVTRPSDGQLYVVDVETGQLQELPVTIPSLVDHGPVKTANNLYLGQKRTSYMAVDPRSGEVLRRFNGSVIVDDDEDCATLPADTLYVGRIDYDVQVLELTGGRPVWNITYGQFAPVFGGGNSRVDRQAMPHGESLTTFAPPRMSGNQRGVLSEWRYEATTAGSLALRNAVTGESLWEMYKAVSAPPVFVHGGDGALATKSTRNGQPADYNAVVSSRVTLLAPVSVDAMAELDAAMNRAGSASSSSSSSSGADVNEAEMRMIKVHAYNGQLVAVDAVDADQLLHAGVDDHAVVTHATDLDSDPSLSSSLSATSAVGFNVCVMGSPQYPACVFGVHLVSSQSAAAPTMPARPDRASNRRRLLHSKKANWLSFVGGIVVAVLVLLAGYRYVESKRQKQVERERQLDQVRREEEDKARQAARELQLRELEERERALKRKEEESIRVQKQREEEAEEATKRAAEAAAQAIAAAEARAAEMRREHSSGDGDTREAEAEAARRRALVTLRDDEPVSIVGKLAISERVLGHGCQGTVVLRGEFEGRPVAVKRMLREFVDVSQHEIDVLLRADDHAHVIRYYCREDDDRFVYIALELCELSVIELIELGHESIQMEAPLPLSAAVRETMTATAARKARKKQNRSRQQRQLGLVTTLTVTEVARQMLEGLRHLHSLNIVHRDVKPHNVLITSKHKVLISDFGLCKRLTDGQSSYETNVAGTQGYVAPEMLKEERMTRAVDLFGVGCTLFFMLTGGGHPFGTAHYERESNIRNGCVDLSPLDGDLEARDLVARLLHTDPVQRGSASLALAHPFFWSSDKRLKLLTDVSDRIEKEERDGALMVALQADAPSVIGPEGWRIKLSEQLLQDLRKFRKYDEHGLRDLLRALRNKVHHYQEISGELKSELGSLPEGLLHYFTSRFPTLVLYVTAFVQNHLAHEPLFRDKYMTV